MIRFFKIVATLEGLSFLILLFFAYGYRTESMIRILGPIHGALFIAYLIAAFMLKESQNWDTKKFLIVCLASVIPFGTFYIEYKYFRNTQNT